jgi:ATPases involved in chromosome partitioning
MANGKVVSIGNQKGGVGKSTITSLVANYLHNNYPDIKILVVDADDYQNSLIQIRNAEIQAYSESNPNFDENELYQLVKINSADYPDQDESLRNEYDIIFIDFPGNLKQDGVLTTYHLIDHLFIPTGTSKMDIDSTFEFAGYFKDQVANERKKCGLNTTIYGFFNRVVKNNLDFKQLYEAKQEFPISFMENFITESPVTFQRFVSTIEVYQNSAHNNYEDFCKELLTIIYK